jgi:hypothetical protein
MRFSKGYKKDSRDYGYPSHHGLMAIPPTLPTPNLLPFTKGFIWQDGAGMCVAMAVKRAAQQWLEANGYQSQPMISGDFAYKTGRVAERIGQYDSPEQAPPIEDGGSEPGLVLLAGRSVGVRLESKCPDPSTAAEVLASGVAPWSLDRINDEPSPDDLVDAYDMIGLEFFEVVAPIDERRQAIQDCMVRRQPVIFSLVVDTGFEHNVGEVIRSIDQTDPNGGGHMLCAADASRDLGLVFCNWWRNDSEGISWGDVAGNGILSWELVESNIIQLFAVRAAPLTLRKAV